LERRSAFNISKIGLFFASCLEKRVLAVEVPRFGKGSGAKEDPSPASALANIIMKNK
jgi:hypothetical protein